MVSAFKVETGTLAYQVAVPYARPNNVYLYQHGTRGYGQHRDVRIRKGTTSVAFLTFEGKNLTQNASVISFGSEVQLNSPRRRHNQILEAF